MISITDAKSAYSGCIHARSRRHIISILALLTSAWPQASSSAAPSNPSDYAAEIGKLTPMYVATLSCAEEAIGLTDYNEFKKAIEETFGPKAASDIQKSYDEGREVMEQIPPSKRRQVVANMKCVNKSQELGRQIKNLWEDAAWAIKRSKQK